MKAIADNTSRKAYQKPTLEHFGSIQSLTLAGVASRIEQSTQDSETGVPKCSNDKGRNLCN